MSQHSHHPLAERVSGTRRLPALREAALLAHWIPDLGFHLTQPGRPTVRVASWPPPDDFRGVCIGPCEFRSTLVRSLTGECAGLASIVDDTPEASTEIVKVTRNRTTLGPLGLVRHEVNAATGVLAFATCASEVDLLDPGTPTPPRPEDRCVGVDHDAQLGVALVHACFVLDDEQTEGHAYRAVVEQAVTLSVDALTSGH